MHQSVSHTGPWRFLGAEFQPTILRIKKINHLRMQTEENRGKIYANPQPAATRL
jgi:hypothetical protein